MGAPRTQSKPATKAPKEPLVVDMNPDQQLPPRPEAKEGESINFDDLLGYIQGSNEVLLRRMGRIESDIESGPEVKEAVEEELEDLGETLREGFMESRPVRFARWVGEPLKPRRPTMDGMRNAVVLTAVELTAARYIPPVRGFVINRITPTI